MCSVQLPRALSHSCTPTRTARTNGTVPQHEHRHSCTRPAAVAATAAHSGRCSRGKHPIHARQHLAAAGLLLQASLACVSGTCEASTWSASCNAHCGQGRAGSGRCMPLLLRPRLSGGIPRCPARTLPGGAGIARAARDPAADARRRGPSCRWLARCHAFCRVRAALVGRRVRGVDGVGWVRAGPSVPALPPRGGQRNRSDHGDHRAGFSSFCFDDDAAPRSSL